MIPSLMDTYHCFTRARNVGGGGSCGSRGSRDCGSRRLGGIRAAILFIRTVAAVRPFVARPRGWNAVLVAAGKLARCTGGAAAIFFVRTISAILFAVALPRLWNAVGEIVACKAFAGGATAIVGIIVGIRTLVATIGRCCVDSCCCFIAIFFVRTICAILFAVALPMNWHALRVIVSVDIMASKLVA